MALAILLAALIVAMDSREPLAYKVEAKMPDIVVPISPGDVQLGGFVGERVRANEANRLPNVDLEPLLAGFRKKPGSHPWIGEHIGKWMHAATLAWAHEGDPKLKAKLDYAAKGLIKAQEPDGYLGTYTTDKRFGLYPEADWDVWSHKYCLIGLLTYYRFTGYEPALAACRKAGNLLIATFGPGKKSILGAGTHKGMAATSVLEPIVLLYRSTGEGKYLEFAQYIVRSWDEPGGPRILTDLLAGKHVGQIANGKAYEMLSNIVGLCELARATGEPRYLQAAKNAWDDVVHNQLYITGTASYYEHFHADHDLPTGSDFNVGETCVTVTWMQLCEQLFRLTGEAKYADEFERSVYNHLAAAQRPDGSEWCYYTPLDGTKRYTGETCCCLSSGPRGMALAPEWSYARITRGGNTYLAINVLESSRVKLSVGGQVVEAAQQSEFPHEGRTKIQFHMDRPARFGVLIRAPHWAAPMRVAGGRDANGWIEVPPKTWKPGSQLTVTFNLRSEIVRNGQQAALTWGPFVLALAAEDNRALGSPVQYALSSPARPIANAFNADLTTNQGKAIAKFRPFADIQNGDYRIWLRAPGVENPLADSLFLEAPESRSVAGNVKGSITDGDANSFIVTFDGKPQSEAWFAVSLPRPVEIRRIVFVHGHTFHDGGWFDTSRGKPQVQVRDSATSEWRTVGSLDDYPPTTATSEAGLTPGQTFTLTLATSIKASEIRVIGQPACGDNPNQSFASCAELAAFKK